MKDGTCCAEIFGVHHPHVLLKYPTDCGQGRTPEELHTHMPCMAAARQRQGAPEGDGVTVAKHCGVLHSSLQRHPGCTTRQQLLHSWHITWLRTSSLALHRLP